MLIFCICLLHAWVLHADAAQARAVLDQATAKLSASSSAEQAAKVPLYPAHKALALQRGDKLGAFLGFSQSLEESPSPQESRRCRAGRCLPDVKQLRAAVRADLRRPPALINDKAIHIAGLDRAIHDLETLLIRTMTRDLETLKNTRAASIFTFREHIDYDARLATSPGIRTVCEVGFYSGQSSVVFLESNPKVKVIGFDDFYFTPAEAAYNYLLHRYPDRIRIHRGNSLETIPALIAAHTGADGVYRGPVCDLIRTDGRPEYELRRQDFAALQPMTSCSTLVLFNDVCDMQNCHLYQVKNCYWQYGTCVPQEPLFFEGSVMVYEELLRRQIVEPIDEFYLGKQEPNFYKSWALARMTCGPNAKPKLLPTTPLFSYPEATQASMQACYKKGGCSMPIN